MRKDLNLRRANAHRARYGVVREEADRMARQAAARLAVEQWRERVREECAKRKAQNGDEGDGWLGRTKKAVLDFIGW